MAKKSTKTKASGTKTAKKSSGTKTAARSSGAKSLVIVESPAKAKTINKYLGSDFVVEACKGHVRDLPKNRYAIDPGRNFEPTYEIMPSHQKLVTKLRSLAATAPTVYLATDLDREGEAIAWHLVQALDLDPERIQRVIFNEITKSAIQAAFDNPHQIDVDKVNAQQARRILDRIVGYELSPLLWKKVAKGLSAGRVQSVAVRIIVDRELEIRAFQPQEYWAVDGVFTVDLEQVVGLRREWAELLTTKGDDGQPPTLKVQAGWLGSKQSFRGELVQWKGNDFKAEGSVVFDKDGNGTFETAMPKVREAITALGLNVEDAQVTDWDEYKTLGLKRVVLPGSLGAAADKLEFRVRDIETKRTRSKPSAPFTTASLQQSAANQLRFATSRTMRIAQSLYEGIDLGDGQGPVGLITYMRTDSTNLSKESVAAARDLVGKKYGDAYLPEKPNVYGSKAKGAQEAHEAIRPTDPNRTPESMRGHLNDEQYKLYQLIWGRFVACQMTPAEWDATTVKVAVETPQGEAIFKAGGRVLVFDGFYKVTGVPKSDSDPILPPLSNDQRVAPLSIDALQKFTPPPPRFSEASLVKTLEAEGIGRPSTYSSIIDTIQSRGYVEQIDRRFYPTARGEVVTKKLIEHFPQIMDLKFTSYMEGRLDKIEEAHLDWHGVLHEFYDPFRESLGKAHEEMDAVRAEPSEYKCETCGKPLVYRFGRNGRFLSCSGFPECKVAFNVDRDGKPIVLPEVDLKCEKCGKPMQLRKSRTGPFLGCSGYPECNNTVPCDEEGHALTKVKPEDIKEKCDDCGSGMRVTFFRGKSFLGCTNYPTCKATKPMPEGIYVERPKPEDAGVPCDKCGKPMVIRKSRRGPFLSCSGFPRCRNAKPMEKLDELKALAASGATPKPADDGDDDTATTAGAKKKKTAAKASKKTAAKGASADAENLAQADAGPYARTRTGKIIVEDFDGPIICPSCNSEMPIKSGRWGPFLSCSNFPRCKETGRLKGEALRKAEEMVGKPEPKPKPIPTDVDCPDCGAKMVLRMGRTGRFLGCGAYPKCKKTMEPPAGLLREIGAAETAAGK